MSGCGDQHLGIADRRQPRVAVLDVSDAHHVLHAGVRVAEAALCPVADRLTHRSVAEEHIEVLGVQRMVDGPRGHKRLEHSETQGARGEQVEPSQPVVPSVKARSDLRRDSDLAAPLLGQVEFNLRVGAEDHVRRRERRTVVASCDVCVTASVDIQKTHDLPHFDRYGHASLHRNHA